MLDLGSIRPLYSVVRPPKPRSGALPLRGTGRMAARRNRRRPRSDRDSSRESGAWSCSATRLSPCRQPEFTVRNRAGNGFGRVWGIFYAFRSGKTTKPTVATQLGRREHRIAERTDPSAPEDFSCAPEVVRTLSVLTSGAAIGVRARSRESAPEYILSKKYVLGSNSNPNQLQTSKIELIKIIN